VLLDGAQAKVRQRATQCVMPFVSILPLDDAQLHLDDAAPLTSPGFSLHTRASLRCHTLLVQCRPVPLEQRRHVQELAPQLLLGEHVEPELAVGRSAVPIGLAPTPLHVSCTLRHCTTATALIPSHSILSGPSAHSMAPTSAASSRGGAGIRAWSSSPAPCPPAARVLDVRLASMLTLARHSMGQALLPDSHCLSSG
jgi:hypothetical protein